MKMHEIKELTKDELELRLADSEEELSNLRFQHAMHQLDNPVKLREVRRDIARIKTVLHEYELGVRSSGVAQEVKEKSSEKNKIKKQNRENGTRS